MILAVFLAVTAVFARLDGLLWTRPVSGSSSTTTGSDGAPMRDACTTHPPAESGAMTETTAWVDPLDRAVENVEEHQRCGFFHPYTCGNRDHKWRKDDGWTTLKPEKRGGDIWLVCPCGYEQRLTAMDGMLIEGVRQAGNPLTRLLDAANPAES